MREKKTGEPPRNRLRRAAGGVPWREAAGRVGWVISRPAYWAMAMLAGQTISNSPFSH